MDNNKSNGVFLLVSTVILAAVLLFVGFSLTSSMKNNQQTSQGITNTVSVVGEGKTTVSPDTLEINVSVSEMAKTTALAQKAANDKVTQIKGIISALKISKDNIQTTNVSTYPEYDYSNGQQKIIGYRSAQSLNIKVNGDNFATVGGDVIDKISAIGKVNIDSTYFTLKDPNKAMLAAREKAFADAKAKAEQLAKVGNVTLGKPVMITDNAVQYTPTPYYRYAEAKGMGATADMAVTSTAPLSEGQSEVSVTINVVFEIK